MKNYKDPVPLYYKIKEDLKSDIANGKWGIGDIIPSENEISIKYGVSRNTAKHAIDELATIGLVERKQGLGTFVAAPKLEQGLLGFYSFSKSMEEQGIPSSVKVISLTKEICTGSQAKYLEIEVGEELFVLKRIRFADNMPIMIDTSRIPAVMTPGLEKCDFEEKSLYNILAQKYNIYVTRAKEIFEPTLINRQESEILKVMENSPAILLDRIAYSSKDEPIELCRSIVPGDKCRFYTELR